MTVATFSEVVRGVAIGDAWGDPNEFSRLSTLTAVSDRGPEVPQRMRITDDTQMTLFLGAALDEARGADMATTKKLIMDRFLDYYHDKDTMSRAPGGTVMGSLGHLRSTGTWTLATDRKSDGSGTVMRTSAVAFEDDTRWVGIAAFAAAVTHGTANAIAAAILQVALLRDILDGYVEPGGLVDYAEMVARYADECGLTEVGEWLDDYEVPGGLQSGFDELTRLLGEARQVLPELRKNPWGPDSDPSTQAFFEVGPTGAGWRAHHTLVVALLALDMFPNHLWEGLRRSVVTSGDSDTIGAVAGALVGALDPILIEDKWEELRERFEDRYLLWIENEADEYEFLAPEVEGTNGAELLPFQTKDYGN